MIKTGLMGLLAAASLAVAADFPEGSPKFGSKLETALAEAKTSGKPVVAVFSAVWCPPCQMMKKEVYPSEAIKPFHDKFVWVYIDTDEASNAKDALNYGVSGIPHIEFLSPAGKSLDKQIGASAPDSFAKTLEGVLKKNEKAAVAAKN